MAPSKLAPADAYRQMALIRAFEERCLSLAAEGLIAGSVHTCIGQEAIPVGALAALRADDRVVATYRGHGWALACGVPTEGLLGEVCQRAGGVNGGRAGSPLLCSPEHRLLGENSIVGAGVPIATGVALAMRAQARGSLVLVSIGDGAMSQGATHEGLVFAAARALPVLVVCENNGWAEMTPTHQIVRGTLADRVAGYGIESEVVDGGDPLAVHDAVLGATARLREGAGPVFLECRTVRLSGHYNGDIEHYRPKEDRERAGREEPLSRLRASLMGSGGGGGKGPDEVDAEIAAEIDKATETVRAMPLPSPETAREHVCAEIPIGSGAGGQAADPPGASTETLTYQKAVNAALRAELAGRSEVVVYGEDVGYAGGIFGVSRGLQEEFGVDRVFDMPIAESAILGSAVGAAMSGLRPVVEIMWADFLLVALDQLFNQAANVRYVSRGELSAPMVVRTQQGVTPGSCAQHSQSLEALLAHVPGLCVGLPATAQDAYAMLRAATAHPDPCVLIEARSLYQAKGEVRLDAEVEPVGGARLRRAGSDALIVTWGTMLASSLAAADALAAEGISAAVLDLRWLRPLDDAALVEAVTAASGRVVVAHEANVTGGFGAEVAARVQDLCFDELDAPVARVGSPDVRMPSAPTLQRALVPDASAIVLACAKLLGAAPASTG